MGISLGEVIMVYKVTFMVISWVIVVGFLACLFTYWMEG